jgi:hypothetical protein
MENTDVGYFQLNMKKPVIDPIPLLPADEAFTWAAMLTMTLLALLFFFMRALYFAPFCPNDSYGWNDRSRIEKSLSELIDHSATVVRDPGVS